MNHFLRIAWALLLSSAILSSAKVEPWADTQGNTFKGEPAEVFGPLAVFRTSSGGGRRLPWRLLSPADCVRFHEAVARKTPRADDWAKAKGLLTFDLLDRVKQRKDGPLVKASLAGRPEPLLLVTFFVDNSEGKSWDLLGQSSSPFQDLARKYSGQIEGIQFGINHSKEEHNNMALHMNVPWLLVDYSDQGRIQLLLDHSPPKSEFRLVVFTRDGVPIFAANNPGPTEIQKLFADLGALLDLQRPDNSRTWADRAHYLTAIQPVLHRNDASGPILVGDPLVPQGLRDRKIFRVEARIEVGADGKATNVALKEDGGGPAAVTAALADALKKATVFVPAVDHGKLVAGTYDYLIEIPH